MCASTRPENPLEDGISGGAGDDPGEFQMVDRLHSGGLVKRSPTSVSQCCFTYMNK